MMGDSAADPPSKTNQRDDGQIEIWKKIVDVQQHFNDLELRIRNFALVVTGAFLGLGGYAIKDGGSINVVGCDFSIAGLIVLSAILPLLAFYFMDRFWYHRLLYGSVIAGKEAESTLREFGYKVNLGSEISKNSPITFKLRERNVEIHSGTKMDIFYLVLFVALLIVAFSLGFGVRSQVVPPAPSTAAVMPPPVQLGRHRYGCPTMRPDLQLPSLLPSFHWNRLTSE